MEEVLQKLLESELLNENTKKELSEAFSTKLEEAKKEQRQEIETEVKAELAEKYASDKESLIDALDTKVDEAVDNEFGELREDIENFRDLEAEFAEKLVEARREMSETVKEDMTKVLEALDAYVEMQLSSEFDELRESIEEVRKEEHGRKVLEVIGEQYRKMFTDEGNVEQELAERREELEATTAELREAKERINAIEREQKLEETLESLTGHAREVMEAILQNVPTDKLDEAYNRYIDRVIHDSAVNSEKDDNVLAESKNDSNGESNQTLTEDELESSKVISGDKGVEVSDVSDEDNTNHVSLDESIRSRLKLLSGQE